MPVVFISSREENLDVDAKSQRELLLEQIGTASSIATSRLFTIALLTGETEDQTLIPRLPDIGE